MHGRGIVGVVSIGAALAFATPVALSSLNVSHSFELYEGAHGDQIRARIEGKMLPFFNRVLY